MDISGSAQDQEQRRFLTPWKIVALVVGGLLIIRGYLAWRDRALVAAINDYPAFAAPELNIEFPKTIQYDPLTFVGRGAHAGFWNWSPTGLELTPEGQKHFRMDGDRIVSLGPAGRRQLARIRDRTQQGDRQQIAFFYRWTEISAVTTALLSPPPKPGDEYLGNLAVSKNNGTWQVDSLETRDFDEPVQRLRDAAAGVRR